MIVILAIDDNLGMLFNNRRTSKDSSLRKKIMELSSDSRLFMNEYTYRQFEEDENIVCEINVNNDFINIAEGEDYCFIENIDIMPFINKIDKLILCKWNRIYPSDFKLNINIFNYFKLVTSEDIKGNSHDKITLETYIRK